MASELVNSVIEAEKKGAQAVKEAGEKADALRAEAAEKAVLEKRIVEIEPPRL